MSYTGKNKLVYWSNTWFDCQVLRGGMFAMSFKG